MPRLHAHSKQRRVHTHITFCSVDDTIVRVVCTYHHKSYVRTTPAIIQTTGFNPKACVSLSFCCCLLVSKPPLTLREKGNRRRKRSPPLSRMLATYTLRLFDFLSMVRIEKKTLSYLCFNLPFVSITIQKQK